MRLATITQKLWTSRPTLLGLDLGPEYVRLSALSYRAGTYQLEWLSEAKLPSTEPNHQLRTILNEFVEQTQGQITNTAVALAKHHVLIKELELQEELSQSQLQEFLKLNLATYSNTSPSSLYFTYHLAPTSSGTWHLQLVMAHRHLIHQLIAPLEQAGLRPKYIELEGHALARHILQHYQQPPQPVVLLNFDSHKITTILVANTRMLRYSETLLTNPPNDLTDLWTASTKELDLCLTKHPYAKPQLILLSGNQALSLKLQHELPQYYDSSVELLDPLAQLVRTPKIPEVVLRQLGPRMALSCGLALRVADAT